MIQPKDLQGGPWLVAARDWLYRNKGISTQLPKVFTVANGMTVADCENLAAHVAASVYNEMIGKKL
jgi:hypothetical protein